MAKGNKIFYDSKNIKKFTRNLVEYEQFLIFVNPVYDWFIDNANVASYRLIKAFITNIVPLGNQGKRYFSNIVNKKRGVAAELWKLYNKCEMQYQVNELEIASYSELMALGYNGVHLGGEHPVDDIFKYIGEEVIKNIEAVCL